MNSSNPMSPNTTFVQADPSAFRTVVQRLTGAPNDQIHQPAQKSPFPPAPPTAEKGPNGSALNLHGRRRTTKQLLQLNLQAGTTTTPPLCCTGQFVVVSPVSTLEWLALGSPATPVSSSPSAHDETAMADSGFYLYPSPVCNPINKDPPQLLPLFPVQPCTTESQRRC